MCKGVDLPVITRCAEVIVITDRTLVASSFDALRATTIAETRVVSDDATATKPPAAAHAAGTGAISYTMGTMQG
jgi:hypothetical protein